ncbi:hypothetical protein NUU61_006247 [Penicillium alfredii]|uniref:DUF4185 domain-containing protein n=1 Tax=Penicillium alfredii TaxID=1506179 RepID=A0A9W9F0L7_9EURO|nr:uncharacterized protein NUU61_006247 [Penicillium alfredii]KAJ5091377.1 hypothetical protein NUU61_006247 [Penicillium alfredii]
MQLLVPSLLLATLAAAQNGQSVYKKRLTGEDLDTGHRWGVAGTDLGIPYVLENGAIGYLFGDTFSTQWPDDQHDWRSPVLLRSAAHPSDEQGIVFDSAAGVAHDGLAPEITHNGHRGDDGTGTGTDEVSVIPNDGISFPETKEQIVSFMSIKSWDPWSTNYAGLAHSKDGNKFTRLDVKWPNPDDNSDPFQMWTMQRDGNWVYVFSVRAGRQAGPMMLQRVPWDKMADKAAYQGWGWNGKDWGWGRPCSPILEGKFGEPSVRKLSDGTWAMVYLDLAGPHIVSRTAKGPDQPWSKETVQVTWQQEPNLYGGFIHPWSTSKKNDLHLMVSKWAHGDNGRTTAYHMSQYVGTL